MSVRKSEAHASDGSLRTEHGAPATGDGGAGLVFWWLIAMALAGFAPCMILPAWRDYQEAELTERVRAAQASQATAQVDKIHRRLDAIHNDPAVVARLARRELHFHVPGEVLIDVPTSRPAAFGSSQEGRSEALDLKPIDPPVALARLFAYLPHLNYDRLFRASPTREMILALSAALFLAAFVVFWPKPQTAS